MHFDTLELFQSNQIEVDSFLLSFLNLCFHFVRIWLKTNIFRIWPLEEKTITSVPLQPAVWHNIQILLLLASFCCSVRIPIYVWKWSGRFLGEISARKWETICIEFIFLWLGVYPKGQMSLCVCSEGHLSSGNMQLWAMSSAGKCQEIIAVLLKILLFKLVNSISEL